MAHILRRKVLRFVIARSEATWESRGTRPDHGKALGAIAADCRRLPRPLRGLAMTNSEAGTVGGYARKFATAVGAHNPQGARRIRKAAKPPTAAQ